LAELVAKWCSAALRFRCSRKRRERARRRGRPRPRPRLRASLRDILIEQEGERVKEELSELHVPVVMVARVWEAVEVVKEAEGEEEEEVKARSFAKGLDVLAILNQLERSPFAQQLRPQQKRQLPSNSQGIISAVSLSDLYLAQYFGHPGPVQLLSVQPPTYNVPNWLKQSVSPRQVSTPTEQQ